VFICHAFVISVLNLVELGIIIDVLQTQRVYIVKCPAEPFCQFPLCNVWQKVQRFVIDYGEIDSLGKFGSIGLAITSFAVLSSNFRFFDGLVYTK